MAADMALSLFYVTNNPDLAEIVENSGVDIIWIDLETMGKDIRQANMNSLKSSHCFEDISSVKLRLNRASLLVRLNPPYKGTRDEVEQAVGRGADMLMLPMFRTREDAESFVDMVAGRAKVWLLAETVGATESIGEIARIPGVDRIHIGINDLHLEKKMDFMFELLADGTVDALCSELKSAGMPFGFGGVTSLHGGLLPGFRVIAEHTRIGSSSAILARSFFNPDTDGGLEAAEQVFMREIPALRRYEEFLLTQPEEYFIQNRAALCDAVAKIALEIRNRKRL